MENDNAKAFCFAERVKKYRAMVFRIAYGYTKDTHDADDITQEVFLKLYKTETIFYAEENVRAWLIRVVINQAKSHLKTVWNTRRSDLSESIAAESESNNPAHDDCLDLYRYVDGLKPKYRTIIYLYYYEGYSVKEIAVLLKIRETNVTTQLSRARSQLKDVILKDRAESYLS